MRQYMQKLKRYSGSLRTKVNIQALFLQMGAFHVIRAFLSIFGKRFQGAGLDDLIVESEVVSNGSIPGVMAGKHYNRAVYAHKITYEALLRALWAEFEEICSVCCINRSRTTSVC